jgi:hypothetical protein
MLGRAVWKVIEEDTGKKYFSITVSNRVCKGIQLQGTKGIVFNSVLLHPLAI